jgi:hypothetical protein
MRDVSFAAIVAATVAVAKTGPFLVQNSGPLLEPALGACCCPITAAATDGGNIKRPFATAVRRVGTLVLTSTIDGIIVSLSTWGDAAAPCGL